MIRHEQIRHRNEHGLIAKNCFGIEIFQGLSGGWQCLE